MAWANGFQLIAGLCFAALTLGRPFMRSDSATHRLWHTAIGVVGMITLVVATVLSASTQQRYINAFNNLADSVHKLATPASVKESANVDQILAAAASKLTQQDKEIQGLKTSMAAITHPRDGIYIRDTMVARAQGNIQRDGDTLVFQLIIAGPQGLDFNTPLDFQTFKIKCSQPDQWGQSGSYGVLVSRYPNTKCLIIGQN
jgi:hypothetical protein